MTILRTALAGAFFLVSTLGVAFALIIRIYRQYKTLDEPLLLERMK